MKALAVSITVFFHFAGIASSEDHKVNNPAEGVTSPKKHWVAAMRYGIKDLMECVAPDFRKYRQTFPGTLDGLEGAYVIVKGKLYFAGFPVQGPNQTGAMVNDRLYRIFRQPDGTLFLNGTNPDEEADQILFKKSKRAIHIASNSGHALAEVQQALGKEMSSGNYKGSLGRILSILDKVSGLQSSEWGYDMSTSRQREKVQELLIELHQAGKPEVVFKRLQECVPQFAPNHYELMGQLNELSAKLKNWQKLYTVQESEIGPMQKQIYETERRLNSKLDSILNISIHPW